MDICDFSRSFLQFTSDRSRHTPRMQLDASCAITPPGGARQVFYLTCPCIAENMYLDAGLIQDPATLFFLIANHNDQFLMQKFAAASARDKREALRVGEKMSTNDGKGATVLKIEIGVAVRPGARRVTTYAEIRRAILGNVPLQGFTKYVDQVSGAQVELEYPIKTCNIPHDRERWQIDTGPIVLPDPARRDDLPVARMNTAHIVYNTWDWAEVDLIDHARSGDPAAQPRYYNRIVRMDKVTNEIYEVP